MPEYGRAMDPTQWIWGALALPPVSLLFAVVIAGNRADLDDVLNVLRMVWQQREHHGH